MKILEFWGQTLIAIIILTGSKPISGSSIKSKEVWFLEGVEPEKIAESEPCEEEKSHQIHEAFTEQMHHDTFPFMTSSGGHDEFQLHLDELSDHSGCENMDFVYDVVEHGPNLESMMGGQHAKGVHTAKMRDHVPAPIIPANVEILTNGDYLRAKKEHLEKKFKLKTKNRMTGPRKHEEQYNYSQEKVHLMPYFEQKVDAESLHHSAPNEAYFGQNPEMNKLGGEYHSSRSGVSFQLAVEPMAELHSGMNHAQSGKLLQVKQESPDHAIGFDVGVNVGMVTAKPMFQNMPRVRESFMRIAEVAKNLTNRKLDSLSNSHANLNNKVSS